MVRTVFGPIHPPHMQWRSIFEQMLPEILARNIPVALSSCTFRNVMLVKRTWDMAFNQYQKFQVMEKALSTLEKKRIATRRLVARTLNFEPQVDSLAQVDLPIFSASLVSVQKKRRSLKMAPPLV